MSFLESPNNPGADGPALTDSATIYVTTGGSDSHDGLSWQTAKATVGAAITALPAHGGIVEIGYGSLPGWTVPAGRYGITFRGRGTGQPTSITDASVAAPGTHPTLITSTITLRNAGLVGSGPESGFNNGCRLEDMAVTTAVGDGLVLEAPYFTARNVVFTGCAGNGVSVPSQYSWLCRWYSCRFEKCGGYGFTGTVQANVFIGSAFDGNALDGCNMGASGLSEDWNLIDCFLQRNSGAALSGASGTFVNLIGCHVEGNNAVHQILITGGTLNIWGGVIYGNGTAAYGLRANNTPINIANVRFAGHTISSIDSQFGGTGYFAGTSDNCVCLDPFFITGFMSPNIPAALAGSRIDSTKSTAKSVQQQTLAASGAVAINASLGDLQQITLGANATSSTISNALVGQEMAIDWIQDATGTRTYAWPANCKFAGGAAPVASALANYIDRVTFMFDGTNWTEKSRSIGVH